MNKIIEALLLFCDAQDNATQVLRNELKKLSQTETPQPHEEAIPETLFSQLTWRQENGAKLGAYEIALINDNDRGAWQKAYDFLQNQGATISNRFHEEAYRFSYWLYDQMDYKIFRQQLKEAQK